MLHPYHREKGELAKFDYIVSNPPFKMDFSDYHASLDTQANKERFFAGTSFCASIKGVFYLFNAREVE